MKKNTIRNCVLAVAATVSTSAFSNFSQADAAEINIYSYRQEILIRPLIDRFEEKTGIVVNLVNGKADVLLERLKSEGDNSPADILLTADAGRLVRAKEAGVLKSVESDALNSLIPAKFRDPEGYWYGLSMRARVIYTSVDRMKEGEITTYEQLADPKWKNSICIRSSSNVYNQSLLGSLIVHNGEEAAQKWADGVVANMARKPQGGDRDQIKAIAAGECDIAVGNTYYLGRMLASGDDADKEAGSKVRVIFPNQDGRGTHVNVSGGAITKSSHNTEDAIKFLEFLASDEAQVIYAQSVYEYPLRAEIEKSPVIANWGDFKADDLPLADFASKQKEAVQIFDKAGWR